MGKGKNNANVGTLKRLVISQGCSSGTVFISASPISSWYFYIKWKNYKITLIKNYQTFPFVFHFFLFFNRPFSNGFKDKPSPSILSIVSKFFYLILLI